MVTNWYGRTIVGNYTSPQADEAVVVFGGCSLRSSGGTLYLLRRTRSGWKFVVQSDEAGNCQPVRLGSGRHALVCSRVYTSGMSAVASVSWVRWDASGPVWTPVFAYEGTRFLENEVCYHPDLAPFLEAHWGAVAVGDVDGDAQQDVAIEFRFRYASAAQVIAVRRAPDIRARCDCITMLADGSVALRPGCTCRELPLMKERSKTLVFLQTDDGFAATRETRAVVAQLPQNSVSFTGFGKSSP